MPWHIHTKKPFGKQPVSQRVFFHKIKFLLNSGQILTSTGIDLDLVAVVYEERYIYGSTSLYGSRLGCTLCGITLEARLGVGDLQLYEQRRLNREYLAVVEQILTVSFSFTNFRASPITSLARAICS